MSFLRVGASALILSSLIAFQPQSDTNRLNGNHLADPFAEGWMVSDTNGDGITDFVVGKVVVPNNPSASQNAAAADIAARIGFATSGFTPPIVISAAADSPQGSRAAPRIYVGRPAPVELQVEEGGVFSENGNILVAGHDDAGLLAAAEAFSARSPYLWRAPGDRLSAIAEAVNQQVAGANAVAIGLTYLKGKAGVYRAFLTSSIPVNTAALDTILGDARFANLHQIVISDVSATNAKPQTSIPSGPIAAAPASDAPTAAEAPGGEGAGDGAAGPARLDLASIYTMRGLFRGTPRMPIPSNLDGQLYVPSGEAGIAMANLAARMGMETTGITLPLATPADSAVVRDVRTKSVVAESSEVGKEALRRLKRENPSDSPIASGVGELRIVDKAFGRQTSVLVRGNEAAALGLLSGHLPNLWEPGKQNLSLEEMRFDLHRFFSLRSGAGQASVALYRLDKWADEIKSARNVKAKVYVDVADPGLHDLVAKELTALFGADVKVETASLHAGTQCCAKLPELHYREPGYEFKPGVPAFQEDVAIPWEGTRLLAAVKSALPKISGPVTLLARVSEGSEVRRDLKKQIEALLPKQSKVTVLCAFKSGVSWLMDDIAPQVKGKAATLKIEFKRNDDPTATRSMFSHARWVQELYPVDEMLAAELKIPLSGIDFTEFDGKGPTYRVHAYDSAGKEILTREFTVTTVDRPYNGVMPEYEEVQVDTGWVHIDSGSSVVLDQRIPTDIEAFWDRYHREILPRVFRTVMSRYHGDLRPEFAPPFDTLKMDFHLSEPNYELTGIDKERISSLEALQEDIFYSTENFVNMMGDLKTGRSINYVGRIIPIVHASEDGKDGHVHLEFYAKADGAPSVELAWTDTAGKRHTERRDLWALNGAMQPRLVGARATAEGPESLTWMLAADFKDDRHRDWVNEEGQDQVDRSIFAVEQARGQLRWLEQMHAAGMYKNDLAYPHLREMAFEFELPRPLTEKVDSPAPREYAVLKMNLPAARRPMITDYQPKSVQWDEPISPAESASVLAKLAQTPGVNAYWMGRSYLGENIWVADMTLPSPATLRSVAKETTLKATIVYSGRQHANEVSSTSHILKLADQLANDPQTRALLKQVNVVLHPITNPDGAELSVQLAEITPNNMLHPGYHGALAADVSTGQGDTDPVYPESRTRRQLLENWLPDAFLNPHGYPSHEWVQPFSEYSGWVQTRQGANNGRTWWIPRGWFTSLGYQRDDQHPYSEKIAYEIRDRIVEAERGVPGLLDLETRMNSRYQRFGQRWQPENMQQPIVNGIRIYMALKGAGGGRGGAAPGSGGVGNISPDVTWDSGYTEAPDETAHGDYMKLMASAGLAFDRVHLQYLANSKLRIRRTQREQGGRVTWRIERLRPNLPASESEPPASETATRDQ